MPPSDAPPRPWVIGHRGASGLRPEHTLAAYELAIEQGADFIEPDLVPTRDGVLIARHENEIGGTTDVAAHPEFAGRRTTKPLNGAPLTGWFAEDFTLADLRTLRARERLPELRPGSAAFDGLFGIVTLEELLLLLRERSAALGRTIGLVAELKHASYFSAIGLPLDELLLPVLERHGLTGRDDPVFVESFEPGVLRRLRDRIDVRLVQLIDAEGAPADEPGWTYHDMTTPEGLARIAGHADAIGPAKALIVPGEGEPTSLVSDAQAAGLMVFPWTFRSENLFLPPELRRGEDLRAHGDAGAEYRMFYELGVDGVFSDFPEAAVRARPASSLRGALRRRLRRPSG